MNETANLEQLLGTGTDVRLARRDAYEVLQKLRARGGRTEATERLEAQLAKDDEVVLVERADAKQLLEELKASGRRWISGTGEPREEPAPPEPEPEPPPRKRRFWQRG